jgi:hypothetical protein
MMADSDLAQSDLVRRVQRIEDELARPRPPLEARVAALESKAPSGPKPKDFWERLQASSGIIVALVTAFIGYWLTGSVNQALERRKLETANVEKMRDLITQFNNAKIQAEDAEALGLTLAAFGEFAVPSLLAALGTNTSARANGARTGLLAVGLQDKKIVCDALGTVIGNRSQRYTHLMHQRTVELMGRLECGEPAARALREYLSLVAAARKPGAVATYAATLDPAQPIERDEVEDMFKRLCATPQLRREAGCAQAL